MSGVRDGVELERGRLSTGRSSAISNRCRGVTTEGGIRWLEWPYVRVRSEVHTDRTGDVSEFVVQLEYDVGVRADGRGSSDWRQVARFDHQPDHDHGHDIRDERLHMDVYRDGEKEAVERGFPPVDVNEAPAFCERVFERNAEELVQRFERWHGISGRRDGR
ncbi:DUF7718 family protein [Halorussus halobius]